MSNKIAIVVFSDSEHPASHGRFIHALIAAQEMQMAGRDFTFLFEGMGVTWLKHLHLQDHPVTQHYGSIFDEIRDHVLGACNFCTTRRFEVRESADALKVPMLGAEGEHFSIGSLLDDGYQIITY
ncbi:MAG TPA: hypothetical protein VIY29_19935 [Ktedonobacteraceae bacterium]